MRIHSWGQATGLAGAQALCGSGIRPTTQCEQPAPNDGALQVAVSKPAELIQKLSSLKDSDPTAFKAATEKVAEHFEKLSNLSSGPASRALGRLAQSFASAAESGDLSAFAAFAQPQAPAPAAPPPPVVTEPAPLDAKATALALVDSMTSSDGGTDAVQRLHDLKASDQAKFKRVMGNVAEKLEQLGNLTGGDEGQSLVRLAATFASSAENGNLSELEALRPPAPPPPPPTPVTPPAAPTPLDAGATARGIVDSLTAALAPSTSGDALEKLATLKSSDQATFRKVMNGAAEQLEQLANLAEGADRENLQALAVEFASGSESGNLSGLSQLKTPVTEPTPPPPAPPAPSGPTPLDTKAAAVSVLDSLTSSSDGGSLDKLIALKTSDINSFKQVMNQAAQQLESMANLAEESDRDGLQQLAVNFASSAESGDLSALQALKPPATPEPTPAPGPTPPPAAPPVDARATALSLLESATSGMSHLSGDALQKLNTLKTGDQATFKAVVGRVAEQLEQLGNLSDGDDRSNLLSMAGSLASAAENGDLSALTSTTPAAPEAPTQEPAGAAPWLCNQAREAYARCASPLQTMSEAFGSALAIVDSFAAPAA
ncbi:MAG TPA: hypothetical protein VFZ61_20550 [Polyangiales bacterium]